jgi:hypothetical protein
MTPGRLRYWLVLQLAAVAVGIFAGIRLFEAVTR